MFFLWSPQLSGDLHGVAAVRFLGTEVISLGAQAGSPLQVFVGSVDDCRIIDPNVHRAFSGDGDREAEQLRLR